MGGIGDQMSVWTIVLLGSVGWLLTYAAHSTLLLSLAWLCTRYVRPYRLKEIIWKTALVGGILTATLQITLGISPLTGRVNLLPNPLTEPQVQEPPPTFQVTLASPNTDAVNPSQDRRGLSSQNAAAEAEVNGQATDFTDQAPPLPWSDLAAALQIGAGWTLGLWLVGMTAAMLRLGHIRHQLYVTLKDRRDIHAQSLIDALARLCQAAGVRRPVHLTCTPRISRPITLNSREICLPQRVTQLNADRQESLLAHELAHVKRHDPLWLTISHVLEGLFFFQPLHRLARHCIQECAEYLADDGAARYTGSGLALARCLVEVASWPSHYALPVTVASIAGSMSDLERRVRRLLDGSAVRIETPRWWWAVIAISILAVVAGAGPNISVNASNVPPAIISQNGSPWQIIRLLEFDQQVALAGFSNEHFGIIVQQLDGLARYTSDGGRTWNKLENQCESPGDPGCACQSWAMSYCFGLDVVDEQIAWQCGSDASVCRTTDGGQTWQSITEQMAAYPYRCRFLSFLDAQTGWSATPWRLLATEDGGTTWTEIALPERGQHITTVARRTAIDGYVLDDKGNLLVTHDAGESWETHSLGLEPGERLLSQCNAATTMRFLDADTGVVVFSSITDGQTGQTWVAHTSDGGQTWQREQFPSLPEIRGSIYYHHLSHDGKTLTVTGTSGIQAAVLRYQEP
jgi:beta-lactamase regulating signal transducer with metallopeptidase domain